MDMYTVVREYNHITRGSEVGKLGNQTQRDTGRTAGGRQALSRLMMIKAIRRRSWPA